LKRFFHHLAAAYYFGPPCISAGTITWNANDRFSRNLGNDKPRKNCCWAGYSNDIV